MPVKNFIYTINPLKQIDKSTWLDTQIHTSELQWLDVIPDGNIQTKF